MSAGMAGDVGGGGLLGFDGVGPDWAQAERIAAEFMRDLGYTDAHVTQPTSDGGVDVMAKDAIAQVKYQAVPVGRPAIQNIRGVAFDGRQPLVYSWSGFSPGAVAFANEADVGLFHVTVSGPVPITAAAQVLVEAVERTRQRELEEAKAATAAAERKLAETEAARLSAERTAVQAEVQRRDAQAAAARARDAEKKAKDRAQQRADTLQLRRGKREWRASRHSQRVARRETVQRATAERKAVFGNELVQTMRWALGLSVIGLVCPVGISIAGFVVALRARAVLGSQGVKATPRILRWGVVLSAIGTTFTGLVLVSVVVQVVDDLPSGELPDWSGGLLLAVLVGVPLAMLMIWERAKSRSLRVSGM